ncbi:integrase, catalytic region, zinc finger, CCHC-type containing protein [Tanacetum coccineum]
MKLSLGQKMQRLKQAISRIDEFHIKIIRAKHTEQITPIEMKMGRSSKGQLRIRSHVSLNQDDIVEEGQKLKDLLHRSLAFACRYTKHSQELLNLCLAHVQRHDEVLPNLLAIQSLQVQSWVMASGLNNLNFGTINDLARNDHYQRMETPTVVIKFLKQIQVGLNKTVRFIRTDNGTEFVNKTLYDYYESVGIFHQKTVPRTPQQNGIVKRRNRTLVEAARTMLIFSKALMFLWAEVVATACYTQNRSLIHTRHDKNPYELVHNKKPDLTFFWIFGALCYPTNDRENLGKLQPRADIGILIG